jgi:hypothetical protein
MASVYEYCTLVLHWNRRRDGEHLHLGCIRHRSTPTGDGDRDELGWLKLSNVGWYFGGQEVRP